MATTITLREHAARQTCVLHLTAKAAAIPQAVTVLSYASMRLRYPRTFRLMREIVACQCDKAYCGHHIKQHARDETGQPSRCTVEGCKCGYFLKGDR